MCRHLLQKSTTTLTVQVLHSCNVSPQYRSLTTRYPIFVYVGPLGQSLKLQDAVLALIGKLALVTAFAALKCPRPLLLQSRRRGSQMSYGPNFLYQPFYQDSVQSLYNPLQRSLDHGSNVERFSPIEVLDTEQGPKFPNVGFLRFLHEE